MQSMTGFASLSGHLRGADWVWEIRSVNGRGLDIRLRLPEGAETLEPLLRAAIAKRLKRGNVSVSLKLSPSGGSAGPRLNRENLALVIAAAKEAMRMAEAGGMNTDRLSVAELVANPVVWSGEDTPAVWLPAARAQIDDLVAAFAEARLAEGAAMGEILAAQLGQIETLAAQARASAGARNAAAGDLLRDKVRALLDITDLADEGRLAQELAVLAVKADVTEELDRLDAHIAAARALLGNDGPVGRKFDFLMQEFNRETNTLCSKSGSPDLTAIGLDLKLVIDQMREQVQNLE